MRVVKTSSTVLIHFEIASAELEEIREALTTLQALSRDDDTRLFGRSARIALRSPIAVLDAMIEALD